MRQTVSRSTTRATRPLGRHRLSRGRAPSWRLDLDVFRRLLHEERRRIAREIASMAARAAQGDGGPHAGSGGADDDALVDAALSTIEHDRDAAVESSLRAVIADIDTALRRLRAGTYGVCVRCRDPINPQRLRAIPYATLCVRCKAAEERAGRAGARVPFREWRVLKTTWGAEDDEDGQK